MNYFGLFFSFMLPGIVLGLLAAFSMREAAKERQRKADAARRAQAKRAAAQARQRKRGLYISNVA